ncbi:Orn/Lys/Arg decarboxylase [Klebsormidium nitens]|uniref:Orn/Lys/Arg decarboxylase n=1 Tax=Klebsormidium nitens TaxID=105231 RepID=A0A1Y1HZP2_KLENI|nr:Orn/Lys/Arg decarboxylase [Klebsormidium nitens]|eukprot:GAQ84124.1 Orn/Lys/Arg decarboxylase [Klebsormidium nitens]
MQCRAAAGPGKISELEYGAHHPQHQTRNAPLDEDDCVDCAESAESNGISGKEEGGRAPLLEAVVQAAERNVVSFESPGHNKGAWAPTKLKEAFSSKVFEHDVSGFPWLSLSEGPVEEAQQLAATAFGADRTWFLVNGSTCGVQAAVMATCKPGDVLILPRNCHQSAVSAMVLSGARPKYVLPDYDSSWGIALGVPPHEIERALTESWEEGQTVGAVLIVSPTYHGVCSDISRIAEVCHAFGVPLLVDEAHGGHFNFHPAFPGTALESGADVAIQSTHKVLSAFTQAAMLHLNGDRVAAHRLHWSLQLLQTPRPSHLLLSSLDAARLEATRQTSAGVNAPFDSAFRLATRARAELKSLAGIKVLNLPGMDPLRVALDTTGVGLSGYEADETLVEESGVIAELPWQNGLVFAVGPGSREEDVNRMVDAFTSLAETAQKGGFRLEDRSGDGGASRGIFGEARMSPREAFFSESERVPASAAVGRICAELLCPYPPGIPVLTPGEVITTTAIELLVSTLDSGGTVTGGGDPSLQSIAVACNAPRGSSGADPASSPSDVENSEPLDQETSPLWEAVTQAAERSDAPFYFPGHKKGAGAPAELRDALGHAVFRHDLPEIPGLDNLASPEGPILDAQRLAAAAFGADRTWFLVNGAACGVQAAVMATCKPGDALILPESYSQSALPALVLSGAKPLYVASDAGPDWAPERGVRLEAVAGALEDARAAGETVGAVLLASPTSCGLCSDVTSIAGICHSHGVPLLVDESLGAHLRFHNALPLCALDSGADVVIHATYEGLSALAQAGMLHLKGDRVAAARVDRSLQTLQSSSPSYLLLSSLDLARAEAAQRNESGNNPGLEAALQLAAKLSLELRSLTGINVLEAPEIDPLRVVVETVGLRLSGYKVDEILRAEFGVNCAAAFATGAVFSVRVGSTVEDVNRLVRAFTLLSEAADGGPPLVRRSDVLKDLSVIETECLEQQEARAKSWKHRLPALAEPFESEWERFCGLSWLEQSEIGGRVEAAKREWERRRPEEEAENESEADQRENCVERGSNGSASVVDAIRKEANGTRTGTRSDGRRTRTDGTRTGKNGTETETDGSRTQPDGKWAVADGPGIKSNGSEESLPALLEELYVEGREEMRAWVDQASAALDESEAVRRMEIRAAFETYRKAISQEYEDPRSVAASAGAVLEEIAKSLGELPDEIEVQTLKSILCRKQIRVTQVLHAWREEGGVETESSHSAVNAEFSGAETEERGKEAETAGRKAQLENPFALTDAKRARAQSVASREKRRTSKPNFAELFNAAGKPSSRLEALEVAFERAKRGYLEAGSLVREALQLMEYGSGEIVSKGPFTGRQKEAFSRNESVAAALECASEDLLFIRCLGGYPLSRPRRAPPGGSARRPLEEALDLELRKASRVGRSAQEQLREVLEGLEQAAGPEEGAVSGDAEIRAAERNKCVLRHATSALDHLKRAFGDRTERKRTASWRGGTLDGHMVQEQIEEQSLEGKQATRNRMTPREAFFADIN